MIGEVATVIVVDSDDAVVVIGLDIICNVASVVVRRNVSDREGSCRVI